MVEAPLHKALAKTIKTDVCIIGAGFAGLTCALELAKSGIDVAVVEARRVGWGASGRNGGFVSPRYAQDL
ncbi:MAG TPA: FAD-binding oxidoreductase, partial [Rhizobiales bacterium]|nr:FAD-binding oxidoreductase [Hyphomicrobiales bacterium]